MSAGITQPMPGGLSEGTECGEWVLKVLEELKSLPGAQLESSRGRKLSPLLGMVGQRDKVMLSEPRARAARWAWGPRGGTASAGNAAQVRLGGDTQAPPFLPFSHHSPVPPIHVYVQSFSFVQLFTTPWLWHARVLCPWNFPGKNTGVGCHALLQGVFLTQGSNLGLSHLLHWQVDCLTTELHAAFHPVGSRLAREPICRASPLRLNLAGRGGQRLDPRAIGHSPSPGPGRKCTLCPEPFRELAHASVQFTCSVVSSSLWPRGLQHAGLLCPSPIRRACSNSHLWSRWCHPTISSSVVPFSCLQSFPASGSSPRSQFFASGGQSIGVSASASDLPMNIQNWFPLGLTGLISLQSKGNSRLKKKQRTLKWWMVHGR